MILTLNQLENIAPYVHYKRLELILPNLNTTLKKYNINTDLRIAHFLAQVITESNHFRYIQEMGTGEDYEGSLELGNVERGDGRRYIGRGYIKLIGRRYYTQYKNESNIDVVLYPHYVTTPKVAADVSGWVWNHRRLNLLADMDDLPGITKVLTGSYTHLREREDVLFRAKKQLE